MVPTRLSFDIDMMDNPLCELSIDTRVSFACESLLMARASSHSPVGLRP